MKSRVYVCHTIYHAYISCLKELALPEEEHGKADLVLSTMSNDFGTYPDRARISGLWSNVYMFDEKEDVQFPEVMKYHTDRGNLFSNMLARIKYTRLLGKSQEPYVPVDFREYKDVYVFCDSDPIGYYLNYKKIPYHGVEDGLDTIFYCDDAQFSNRGHFAFKAWMAEKGLIFIPDGYSRYCIDMEVNNTSILNTPCKKYIECPRRPLYERLTANDKDILVHMFVEDVDDLVERLKRSSGSTDMVEGVGTAEGKNDERVPVVLVLSDPLCDLETRERIFRDIVDEYGFVNGKKGKVLIKPHPRDVLDYKALFPDEEVLPGRFPMEMLNFLPGVHFDRVVTVFTVPDAIDFAEEKVFLGPDFMDKYEDPLLHRQNEQF